MPVTGPTVRQRGDVWLEIVTGTAEWPFTIEDFVGWTTHMSKISELVGDHAQRGLLLGDVPIDGGLEARFGVRTGVFAARFARASYVMVNSFDRPSEREVVSRLRTANEWMAG